MKQKRTETGNTPNISKETGPKHGVKWTEEDDQVLKEMLEKGNTYAEIAPVLGRTIRALSSRNDVKGFKVVARINTKFTPSKKVAPMKKSFTRPSEIYESYGIARPLQDLNRNECHFPVEGTGLFCGAPAGKVYCNKHAAICGRTYVRSPR